MLVPQVSTTLTILFPYKEHMWLHRQEGRDLRRAESDIARQKRHTEQSVRKYKSGERDQLYVYACS